MDVTKMQGLQSGIIFAVVLACGATAVAGGRLEPDPDYFSRTVEIAQRAGEIVGLISSDGISANPLEIHAPGASFIKLHFSQFSLPPGVVVEVRNRDGSESYRYSSVYRDQYTFDTQRGDDGKISFSAMSITGDTAIVRVLGNPERFNPSLHRVVIDSFLEGFTGADSELPPPRPAKDSGLPIAKIETSCGQNERYDAVCWADTYPDEYGRSIPVAMLITSSGEKCTAWRVGSGNRLFTAEHCISNQADLDGSEIWFNYEASSCGGSETRDEVKVTGKQLLTTDGTLDYALFTVNNFSQLSGFGYLGLDIRNGVLGEGIFIPQHGLGQPRQLSLESDMNENGLCQIDDDNHDGFAPGSDLGYYCDTTTSSSGSPVISSATGKVLALHHLGGCFNSGSKISLIWPQVSDLFGGIPPEGDGNGNWAPGNQVPAAEFSASCTELSCTFDASASTDSDGSIVNFSWDLGDGSKANGTNIEHDFADAGSFEVSLTVEDDEGATDSLIQTVTLSLPNLKPVAQFSTSCIDNVCNFNASGSKDGDGNIIAWDWLLGDGNSASGQSIEHPYAAAGSYTVTLTIEDNDGASDSSSYTVTLNMPNKEPVADFTASCTGLDCSFDASSSADPDGSITGYSWTFGDGESASGSAVKHSYDDGGNFTVTLTTEDNQGASNSASQSISVEASNVKPAAEFSFSCEELYCNFDAGLSTDADGKISAYRWSFGDGRSGSGRIVTHTFDAADSYSVTLTVEDDQGAPDSRTRTIEASTRPDINLRGRVRTRNERTRVILRWYGAESDLVEIYRDGMVISSTSNSGKYIDTKIGASAKFVRYQLCEKSSEFCSEEITLTFKS